MKPALRVFPAFCALLLSACATPVYQPVSSAPQARLRFIKLDYPTACQAGKSYALRPDASGSVRVTAGQPMHLSTIFRQDTGHCFPAVKFTPQTGKMYTIMSEARAEHCVLTVMLQDTSAQYGARVEPSAVPALSRCR